MYRLLSHPIQPRPRFPESPDKESSVVGQVNFRPQDVECAESPRDKGPALGAATCGTRNQATLCAESARGKRPGQRPGNRLHKRNDHPEKVAGSPVPRTSFPSSCPFRVPLLGGSVLRGAVPPFCPPDAGSARVPPSRLNHNREKLRWPINPGTRASSSRRAMARAWAPLETSSQNPSSLSPTNPSSSTSLIT